jgi:peroxiredoxin
MVRWLGIALPTLLCACSGGARKQTPALPLGGASDEKVGVEMTLPRLGGGKVTVSDLRGRPVVLVLFTTGPLQCQKEAKDFVRLHQRFGKEVHFLGISVDTHANLTMIQAFVEVAGYGFPVLLATPTDLELVGGIGATNVVPRTVLLDRQGRIIQDHGGRTSFARLVEGIKGELRGERTPRATVTP